MATSSENPARLKSASRVLGLTLVAGFVFAGLIAQWTLPRPFQNQSQQIPPNLTAIADGMLLALLGLFVVAAWRKLLGEATNARAPSQAMIVIYLAIGAMTLVFETQMRLAQCDEFQRCLGSLAKGVVWSLLWPAAWIAHGLFRA